MEESDKIIRENAKIFAKKVIQMQNKEKIVHKEEMYV